MRRELSVPFEVRGQRGLVNVRVVANDDTIQFGGQCLQLLPGRERLTYVRATV